MLRSAMAPSETNLAGESRRGTGRHHRDPYGRCGVVLDTPEVKAGAAAVSGIPV